MTEPFISINELSKKLGVPAHTLRYWEKAFAPAIRPTTGAGGRRYYRDEDVIKITNIKALLYDQGYTIAGVKKMLVDGELGHASPTIKNQQSTISNQQSDVDTALELLKKARAELK